MFSQFIPHLICRTIKIAFSYISWQINDSFLKPQLSIFLSITLFILTICVIL